MKRITGLRKRWLLNTAGFVFAIGMACVIVVTLVFSAYYRSNIEADLWRRAKTTSDFFSDYVDMNHNDFYRSCIKYANSFEDRDLLELQFIDAQGRVVASSYGAWAGMSPTTPEISGAIAKRNIDSYFGRDPYTGERIIAVSAPMIYGNGEVIGVLRYVTSARPMELRVALVFTLAFLALSVVLMVAVISSSYYVRSILVPVAEITEKAMRIAGGSYGIQIQKHYNDEIGELADTINAMSVQISQNEKTQREFISSLSHELRTPLTAITGWSETLLTYEKLDSETQRGVSIISREAKRLTEMVVSLLDFTRIQDERMTLNIRQVDIRSEFEDTVFMYSKRLAQEGILLEYLDNDEDIPEISCDPERLRQVFLNILDNAAKHGGDGKRIEASICNGKDCILIMVRDFGTGIPEDELPLVKKKFYKGSSKARGTGIGLAVCDEIVTMHGGSLTLENVPEGGTLVTVRLPISQ